MITRYSLTAEAAALIARFAVDPTEAYEPQYNAAPTHLLPVLTQAGSTGFSFFYWGAPPSMANQKPLGERLINIRGETLADKPSLRKKLKSHRCAIPADGFFAWKRIGRRAAIPFRFTIPDSPLFLIAGLWEEYEDEKDVMHHTFSMITTPASASVIEYSERMPAILRPGDEAKWLHSESESEWLNAVQPSTKALAHYAVSSLVNNPLRNDKRVIQAVPPADQFGNLTLFD